MGLRPIWHVFCVFKCGKHSTSAHGYNHLISNKRQWNNCFIKLSTSVNAFYFCFAAKIFQRAALKIGSSFLIRQKLGLFAVNQSESKKFSQTESNILSQSESKKFNDRDHSHLTNYAEVENLITVDSLSEANQIRLRVNLIFRGYLYNNSHHHQIP